MGGRRRRRGQRWREVNTAQRGLDLKEASAEPGIKAVVGHFLDDDPREQWVGDQRLESYLRQSQLSWIIRLRQELEQVDYSVALSGYEGCGRKALHPRSLVGLLVYGVLNQQASLRGLEELARRDVGAWWICGVRRPDHSTIGKFIQRNQGWLSQDFFQGLVEHLVSKLKIHPDTVAGDGTVIAAACSGLRALRAEAARAAARAQQEAAAAHPEDAQLQQEAEAERIATERPAERQVRGLDPDAVQIVPQEAQAVVQPDKDGCNGPSYKPSILAHASGLIVAQHVHASS